jgi:hypothetical protein
MFRRGAAGDTRSFRKHIRFLAALPARRNRRLTAFFRGVVDLKREVIGQGLFNQIRKFEFFAADSAFEFQLVLRCLGSMGFNNDDSQLKQVSSEPTPSMTSLSHSISASAALHSARCFSITAEVSSSAFQVATRNSIGYESASQLLLTAGDNSDRLQSEASLAALCGVSPVPASSGKVT